MRKSCPDIAFEPVIIMQAPSALWVAGWESASGFNGTGRGGLSRDYYSPARKNTSHDLLRSVIWC